MSEKNRLDEALEALPAEIAPARDLWPHIEARLRDEAAAPPGDRAGPEEDGAPGRGRGIAPGGVRGPGGWRTGWQAAAAAVLLTVGASALTFVATRAHYAPGPGSAGTPARLQPVSARVLPLDYRMARAELMAVLESSLERLDPASRRVVERNLAEIRAALAAIDSALAEDPDNAALQHLLVSTSQQELSLLRSIQRLADNTPQERGS